MMLPCGVETPAMRLPCRMKSVTGRPFNDAHALCPGPCGQSHGCVNRVRAAIGRGPEARHDARRLDQRKLRLDLGRRKLEPLYPLAADEVGIALQNLAPDRVAGQMDMAALPKAGGQPGLGGQVC